MPFHGEFGYRNATSDGQPKKLLEPGGRCISKVWVAVVALRQPRPRSAGGMGNVRWVRSVGRFDAPLDAALLVAARQVPPNLLKPAVTGIHVLREEVLSGTTVETASPNFRDEPILFHRPD